MKKHLCLKTAIISIITCLLIFNSPLPASAAFFNPGFLISDAEFTDYNSMTLGDIIKFLKQKNSYLATFVDQQVKLLAAQIIYDTAQIAAINPKVLLVTLQKEQSLITDPAPTPDQLNWATGYGICDSCSKSDPRLQKFKGFAIQVDYAGRALRFYLDNPTKFKFQTGKTYTIDGQKVIIANDATRALYIYTPHINGNRNFWQLWRDWFAQNYPDGSLLQNNENGAVYLIQNGRKRPFVSKAALTSRYNLDKIIPVAPSVLDKYDDGPPIKYAQYSLLRSPQGTVYLLVNDKKRGIVSQEVFRTIGFNPEEIIDITQKEADAIPEGEPITLESTFPVGALLQNNETGGVYFVQEGIKHPLWSKEILLANFPNLRIIPTTPQELEKFPTGEAIKFKDGELIRSYSNPAVYVISNGRRQPIPSSADFEKLGYKWENVVITSQKAVNLHPLGEPLLAK